MESYGMTKYTLYTFPKIIINQLHYIEKYILITHHSLFKEYINENGLIENYNIFINDFRTINLFLLYNIISYNENKLHQKYRRGIASKNLSETKIYLKEIEAVLISKNQRKYIYQIINIELNDYEIDYMKSKGKKVPKSINKTIIYFIQQGTDGSIKIGISSNIEKRLASLQTGSPYKLKVLLTIKGSEKLEKEIHSKFAEFRLSGEWFKPVK